MATPSAGYRTKDGKRVPSVTTIIGRFKDSGALIKWGYSQGREHERIQSQNHVIEHFRELVPKLGGDALAVAEMCALMFGKNWEVRELTPAPGSLYEVTEKAANAGTIAHDLIEQHVLQGGVVQTEVLPQHQKAEKSVLDRAWNSYAQFQRWLAQTRIQITHTEMGLVSEKHRFGGTLDGIGVDADGKRVLIDWKTSNAVYSDYLIQLAAYGLLLDECQPELAPQGFHLLRVAKESADFGHLYWGELDEQKEAFLLMRRLYELDYITKKRVG